MDEKTLWAKIQELQEPWSLSEIAIATQLLEEFERMRDEPVQQELSPGGGKLRAYADIWSEFALLLRRQIERWRQEANTSSGSRSSEARFHAEIWQERLVQDVLRHLGHR